MTNYKGIIAGIGDKYLGANIIKPEFDAKIYRFIIGKDCIIDGLNLNGNVLSAGMCVAQGYRGKLKTSLTLDTTAYVYGVFKVNFDSDTPDEFYIETSQIEINQKDDILHSAGTYYLLLYKNGVVQLSRDCPANAVYADNTNHINDGGTLGKNVTAPTQPVNDNSEKVANTEYVHNQIEREIGYRDITVSISSDNGKLTGSLLLKKKANYVIGEITTSGEITSLLDDFIFDNIPIGFRPTKTIYFGLSAHYNPQSGSERTIYRHMELNTNGEISFKHQNAASGSYYYSPYVIGYETN